jgi:hypothetical protein
MDSGDAAMGFSAERSPGAANGLLSLPEVMQKLLNTNFRIDAEVVREVLNRDATRRKAAGPSE